MSDGATRTDLEQWGRTFAQQVGDNKDLLTELDAAIGDADHGANMDRGLKAVLVALEQDPPATPATLFNKVGLTLVSTVGGASGPLYGTLFLRLGGAIGDEEPVSPGGFRAARAAGRGRCHRGGSRPHCEPDSTVSSPEARPSPATRRCTTPWPRLSTRSTLH